MTFPSPSSDGKGGRQGRAFIILTLGALLLAAFALRLLYLSRISLFVDEFITMWAAKMILQQGLPKTPAGVFYLRGVLFSYLDALFLGLFGFSEWIARLPSVLLGVLTVASIYLAGKRLFSPPVGLAAAALLTLAPEAIMWDGRARMYSLLQLLALWTTLILYEGLAKADRRRTWALFLLSYLGTLWAHIPAMLFYPAFLLAMAWRRGWRWLMGKGGIIVNVLAIAAVLSRYALDRLGGGQLAPIQEVHPYLQFPADVLGNIRAYSKYFLDPQNLPLSILLLLGSLYIVAKWAKSRAGGKEPETPERKSEEGLAFLCLVFWVPLLEIVIMGGRYWQNPRYLFMLQPFFFLIASAACVQGLRWLIPRVSSKGGESVTWPVALTLVALASLLNLPHALSILSKPVYGYDRAMQFVRKHWREGDVILMMLPSTSAIYLGKCDYYAIQKDYQQYLVKKDGHLVDLWVGAPLLNSLSQLERVLEENRRVWFVTDGWRLAAHYEMDFRARIAQAMKTVYEVQGVKVLLSTGYKGPEEPTIKRSLEANLEGGIALRGYDLSADLLKPGEKLRLTLHWQAQEQIKEDYLVFVHLLNEEEFPADQDDSPPMKGLYPTTYWREGEVILDEHILTIRDDAPPGRYLLEVGIYSPQTGKRLAVLDSEGKPTDDRVVLDYLKIVRGEETPPAPQRPVEANLGGKVRLMGYDLDGEEATLSTEPGATIPLILYWQPLGPIEEDYTVFIHLRNEAGQIWGQGDSLPLDGFYPTSFWEEGETIPDEYQVVVDPQAPSGQYHLAIGMYIPATGQRLPLLDEEGRTWGDEIILGKIMVTE